MVFERVAVDGKPRFFVAPVFEEGMIAAFDSTGGYLQTHGGPGDGPGEFGGIQALTSGPGDTIWVFQAGRLSQLSPAGAVAFVTSLPVMVIRDTEIVGEGLFALNADIHQADRIGHPLHLLAVDGSLRWSGGDEDEEWRADRATNSVLRLARGGEGEFWAARLNRYELVLWDTAGSRLRTLRRTAEWFEPWEAFEEGGAYRTRPRPRLWDIHVDPEGLLWTLVLVPDENWSEPQEVPRIGDLSLQDRVFDTMVEVIDPDGERLLASFRHPGLLARFLEDGSIVHVSQAPQGLISANVYRLSLSH